MIEHIKKLNKKQETPENMRGFGDFAERVFKRTKIDAAVKILNGGKECGGCKKRKEKLNKLIPFKGTTNDN